MDPSPPGLRIPSCSKVAALQRPISFFHLQMQFIVGWAGIRGLAQVDVEREVRVRRTSEETRIATFDRALKRRIKGVQRNRRSSDLDWYRMLRGQDEGSAHGWEVRDR